MLAACTTNNALLTISHGENGSVLDSIPNHSCSFSMHLLICTVPDKTEAMPGILLAKFHSTFVTF